MEIPNRIQLDIIRDSVYAIINKKIGAAVTATNFLRDLEYQIVEIKLDTEIDRATAAERIIHTLDAYITTEWLEQFNLDEEDSIINRGVSSG